MYYHLLYVDLEVLLKEIIFLFVLLSQYLILDLLS